MGHAEAACLKIVYMGFLVPFGAYCADACPGIMMDDRMTLRNHCMWNNAYPSPRKQRQDSPKEMSSGSVPFEACIKWESWLWHSFFVVEDLGSGWGSCVWAEVEGLDFLLPPREGAHGLPKYVVEVSEVGVKSCQSQTWKIESSSYTGKWMALPVKGLFGFLRKCKDSNSGLSDPKPSSLLIQGLSVSMEPWPGPQLLPISTASKTLCPALISLHFSTQVLTQPLERPGSRPRMVGWAPPSSEMPTPILCPGECAFLCYCLVSRPISFLFLAKTLGWVLSVLQPPQEAPEREDVRDEPSFWRMW